MVDQNTDFFKIVDNFANFKHIPSIPIVESKIDFIPKITIAIPTYKRTDLLKEALESALNQIDFDEYEVIVVDNNPERRCETEKLINTYKSIKLNYYKNSENIGMVSNWNRCFELSKTDWVVLLHDDDLLLSNFLNICMTEINKNNEIGILKPKAHHWYSNRDELILSDLYKSNFSTRSGNLKRIYDTDNIRGFIIGAPSSIIFNKIKVSKIGGFNPNLYPTSDYCFVVLFSYYYNVYQLDMILSVYRWLDNATFNVNVLRDTTVNDYYLNLFLNKKFKIPSIISDNTLRYIFTNKEDFYKQFNSSFNFDLDILKIKPINNLLGRLCRYLQECIIFMYRIIYILGGENIKKSRTKELNTIISSNNKKFK